MARFVMAIVLVLLIQSAPGETSAQGRVENYYLTAGSEEMADFVDVESIKTDGYQRKYWILSYYDKPRSGVYYTRALQVADCNNETVKTPYVYFYDDKGSLVHGGPMGENLRPVVPGSLADSTFQFACASPAERLKMNRLKVDDTREAASIWFKYYREASADAAAAARDR